MAFSAAEQSVLDHLPKDILKTEVKEATKSLGIAEDDCLVYSFPVRKFPEYRQEILESMVELQRKYNPGLVFLPSSDDTHQDHKVISEEGFRAFKKVTMLGYEVPWNNLTFHTNTFVSLEETHLQKKIEALRCYKSQAHRVYSSAEFIRSLALVRGTQISRGLAECFELTRCVL